MLSLRQEDISCLSTKSTIVKALVSVVACRSVKFWNLAGGNTEECWCDWRSRESLVPQSLSEHSEEINFFGRVIKLKYSTFVATVKKLFLERSMLKEDWAGREDNAETSAGGYLPRSYRREVWWNSGVGDGQTHGGIITWVLPLKV